MTPAARIQASIELLDQIIDAAKSEGAPADRLITAYFKQRRYAGSKDRRAVRELVYRAIRVCSEMPENGRAAMLALGEDDAGIVDLFDGEGHGPQPIGQGEKAARRGTAPAWLTQALEASSIFAETQGAMLGRAALDCRVNALKAHRDTLELPEAGEPLAAPNALRFDAGTQVEQWDAYKDGLIEVQDHGSQLACMAMSVQPGENIIDLCAGAGGKTLALAAAMQGQGGLVACDTDLRRLRQLEPRAARAGISNLQIRLLNPNAEMDKLADLAGRADLVLVDAPCSGTGTWRRKPEAKWRLTPDRLQRFADLQDHVLEIAAQCVKPGGRIGFVTCSLLDAEGDDRVQAFLARHKGWKARPISLPLGSKHGAGMRLNPHDHGTDGFFVAMLEAPC